MDTADGAKVPDYPKPHNIKPTQVTGASNSVLRVWVCQASYGDTLALEIDPTPPNGAFVQNYYEASMKVWKPMHILGVADICGSLSRANLVASS